MKIKRSFGSGVFDTANVIFLLGLVFVTLYPFYYIAIVSISSGNYVMQGLVKWYPIGVTLESYKIIFKDTIIFRAFGNTVLYTVVGTFINVALTAMCAYPLSRRNFVGRKLFTKIIIFTMFFSGGMIPTYLVVRGLGMRNTIWAVTIPGAISIFKMIVMRTFFQNIPEALTESANIDGANDMQIFFKIIVPLSIPILATMTLFYSVSHWNSFFDPLIYLDKKNQYPLQIILRNIVVQGEMGATSNAGGSSSDFLAVDTTIKYAIIMFATLPILTVYPFVQKYFVKGVMVGSLKE